MTVFPLNLNMAIAKFQHFYEIQNDLKFISSNREFIKLQVRKELLFKCKIMVLLYTEMVKICNIYMIRICEIIKCS